MLFVLLFEDNSQQKKSLGMPASHPAGNPLSGDPAAKPLSPAARLLLQEGCAAMGADDGNPLSDGMISRTKYGKPRVPGLPGFHFNFSHSGNLTACAFSDQEVGLDLQETGGRAVNPLRVARRFFTASEYEALLSLSEKPAKQLELFYRFWTIKEAYLKYIGCGLQGGVDSFLPLACRENMSPCGSHLLHEGVTEMSFTGETASADSFAYAAGILSASRGVISVVKKQDLLSPAVYALLPAPSGFTMTVSAAVLPEEIPVRMVSSSQAPAAQAPAGLPEDL